MSDLVGGVAVVHRLDAATAARARPVERAAGLGDECVAGHAGGESGDAGRGVDRVDGQFAAGLLQRQEDPLEAGDRVVAPGLGQHYDEVVGPGAAGDVAGAEAAADRLRGADENGVARGPPVARVDRAESVDVNRPDRELAGVAARPRNLGFEPAREGLERREPRQRVAELAALDVLLEFEDASERLVEPALEVRDLVLSGRKHPACIGSRGAGLKGSPHPGHFES